MIVFFDPDDLGVLQVQDKQIDEYLRLSKDDIDMLGENESYTFIKNGKPLACFGLIQTDRDTAFAWSYLSNEVSSYMVELTRLAKQVAGMSGFKKIEAYVMESFNEGHRWMRLLGFSKTTKQTHLYDKGPLYCVYERIS